MKPIAITLRQIDFVIAAADGGSTAAAARILNVSQPSVSLAIAKVEGYLGRPLFARTSGQGVVPTSYGLQKLGEFRALRAQAQQVLDTSAATQAILDLGVFSTLGPRYAPSLVRRFQEAHPKAHIRLHEADLETLSGWLESGQIDVALTYDFGPPSSLNITPLADVRPYGLLPSTHPLAGRKSVSMAELLQDPLILMNLPHSRGYFLTLAQMHGISPKIAYETGSVEMLRSMVANNLGVGLLATDITHNTAYDGQPVIRMPLEGNLAPHHIALARSMRLRSSALVDQFCSFAAQSFKA
ncbi:MULTISPECIES: LysR family transcriptional regulator [Limibacillus]|jgi:DNA-binding transcriptional LysR family regulator|uniref:DNA-binding transcriptional LysR family regulator n=1 Tax=Limibacillus halophilus TaxID=1579333 RepID=A0A839SMV2_9PROT|nr:LysR family transcriptional regulator [Limibacillus halophilus]MBB3063772.1 DNA-binding transcriptional LysR family regulator [Limibacillus halophilus]